MTVVTSAPRIGAHIIPSPLHAFRHGPATALAQRAVPLPDLQEQMRHADVRTTLRIYSYSIPATQRAAMESVAAGLQPEPVVPIGNQKIR